MWGKPRCGCFWKRHPKQHCCDVGDKWYSVLWMVHRCWCAEKILPRYFYNHSQWSKNDLWKGKRGLSVPYVSHVLMSHVLVSLSCKGGDFGDPEMTHMVPMCPPAVPGRKLLKVSPATGNPQLRCREVPSIPAPLWAGNAQGGGSSRIPSQPLPAIPQHSRLTGPLQAAPFWLPAKPTFGNGALTRSDCGETAFLQHTAQMRTDTGAEKHPSTSPWLFSGSPHFYHLK